MEDDIREKVDEFINDSKEAVFYLKKKINTTNDISEYNQYLKYTNINQENIIVLIEMIKQSEKLDNIDDNKVNNTFERIKNDIKKSYQIK